MFKRILVPVDVDHEGSWSRPLPVAEQLAADYGAELHVVTVVPAMGMSIVGSFFPPDFEQKALAQASANLDGIVTKVAKNAAAVQRHVAHGTIYEEILAVADKLQCEEIDAALIAFEHPLECRLAAPAAFSDQCPIVHFRHVFPRQTLRGRCAIYSPGGCDYMPRQRETQETSRRAPRPRELWRWRPRLR